MAMSDVVFALRGVSKRYGSRQVLNVEELEIHRGEILAIVGPNGAGKSTLLRLLGFLEPCSSGEIQFEGRVIHYPASLETRRRITMVFQRPLLFRRSVWENAMVGLRLRRSPRDHRVEELLAKLDLMSIPSTPAHALSGGEVQRVALARALAIDPDVLLLDEPTANLDPHNAAMIESIISFTRGGNKPTIVLVTHNVFQARRLAERVALLFDGALTGPMETRAFFDSPSECRVGAFIRGELVC